MIQFNLLPDVKLEYLRSERIKRLVVMGSSIIVAISLVLFAFLFSYVRIGQKRHISNLTKDIASRVDELKGQQDLEKVLTIQNQLKTLPGLHQQKPVVTRLFADPTVNKPGYIAQVTPQDVKIASINIDFQQLTVVVQGSAPSIEIINKFADTLKFTTYTAVPVGSTQPAGEVAKPQELKAFSSVVLAGFGLDEAGVSYQLTATFDKALFDSSQEVVLTVPKLISTRSETEKPKALFQQLQPLPETNPQGR
jgi:hypothetical protein